MEGVRSAACRIRAPPRRGTPCSFAAPRSVLLPLIYFLAMIVMNMCRWCCVAIVFVVFAAWKRILRGTLSAAAQSPGRLTCEAARLILQHYGEWRADHGVASFTRPFPALSRSGNPTGGGRSILQRGQRWLLLLLLLLLHRSVDLPKRAHELRPLDWCAMQLVYLQLLQGRCARSSSRVCRYICTSTPSMLA